VDTRFWSRRNQSWTDRAVVVVVVVDDGIISGKVPVVVVVGTNGLFFWTRRPANHGNEEWLEQNVAMEYILRFSEETPRHWAMNDPVRLKTNEQRVRVTGPSLSHEPREEW
jgi:hypothetical protein